MLTEAPTSQARSSSEVAVGWDRVLRIATFNFKDGGFVDGDRFDLGLLGDAVEEVPDVDVLFLQEARGWDADGYHFLFEAERVLSRFGPLRAFLSPSEIGSLHQVVFLRWPRLRPVRHFPAHPPAVFHDQVGVVHARVDGLDENIALCSVHWPYWSGEARLDAALRLTRYADPETLSIFGGDCNTIASGEDEVVPDFSRLPPHTRRHKAVLPAAHNCLDDGVLQPDRRALLVLEEAGMVNLGSLAEDPTPTVQHNVDRGQGARIDHLLVGPRLAPCFVPGSYQVIGSPAVQRASDHRLVTALLDLSFLNRP